MSNGVSLGTFGLGRGRCPRGAVAWLRHRQLSSLLSFLLAMFLWPLVLLGVDLHISLGS